MSETPKTATYTAVGLIVAGFVVIALGWYGAARLDYPQGQIPYVISGGLSGLGLVGAGLTLVIVMESRRDRALLGAKLDAVLDALHGRSTIVPAVAPGGADGDETIAIGVPAAADMTEGMVVAGRTAYHRPSCHLLEGRTDLPLLSFEEAEDQDLTPCRICDPAGARVG